MGRLLAGVVLTLVAWMLPRWAARTRWVWNGALALDLMMPAFAFGSIAGLSGRPVFAGIFAVSLGAGYAYADRSKRATLDEPIVFTDVFQAFDVFRHPQLALPFPNKLAVVLGAGTVIALYVGLYLFEQPSIVEAPWVGLALIAAAWLAYLLAAKIVDHGSVRWLRSLGATGEPAADASRLGPLGMHWVHGLVARGERDARRRSSNGVPDVELREDAGPIVLVQSESFFDARRLHAAIDADLLPSLDRARRDGVQYGRLTVPCWGANTVRTEFCVLTGLAPADTGFDHFNPYRRFADAPIASIASRLKARGYRTICLHPFDRTFYRRDAILPHLGFDEMLGEEVFPPHAERIDGYISDIEVARKAIALVDQFGPRVFVFVVTMENHGPWPGCAHSGDRLASGLDLPLEERDVLGRYLASLGNGDRMLGMLMDRLATQGAGLLAYYGDHLPGFGTIFDRLRMGDRRSDYAIWRPGGPFGARAADLPAHELAAALLRSAAPVPAPSTATA